MSWEAAKYGDHEATLKICCLVGLALLGHFGLCYALVSRYLPHRSNMLELVDLFAAALRNWAMIIPAFYGVAELRHDHISRWKQVTDMSLFFLVVYVSWNAVHFFILLADRRAFRDKVSMLLHHTISVWSASIMLFSQKMHWFACLAGCCEFTNVFLNFLYMCREVPVGDGVLKDVVPLMFVGNGVLLWLSFVVFRMALFPYLLYTMYTDAHEFPAETWNPMSRTEQFASVSVMVLLFMLSTMWFIPITKGLYKHVHMMLKGDTKSKKRA